MKTIAKSTKITLLLLSMMTMMSNVAIVTVLPHLSIVFKDTPNIELLSRLMITLPSLAIAFFAPFLGHFVNKFGKKNSAIAALVAFSFFGTAGFYLDTIYEILVSSFFFGIAIAILMIVSTSLVVDYFKQEDRHKFMGLQSAFMAIGGILFIVGGGFLSDMDWRYPFLIYAVGLIVLLFALKFIVDIKALSHAVDEEAHLLNHNLWYIYVLAFLLMLLFYILPTQMPFLMMNVFQASGKLTGAIIATAFIFNAAGALTFAKLKQKISFAQIYILGLFILALGFVLIGLVSNVYFFFLTSPIMGFGGGLLMANMTAWMLNVAHHTKRVKSSAYLTSALFFGQFFSPIATHPLVEYFGVRHFFIVMGILLISSLFIYMIFLKMQKS